MHRWVSAALALLVLGFSSAAIAAEAKDPPVGNIDAEIDLKPESLVLSTKIGELFDSQFQENDPYCRAAAVLVAQQAVDSYGYWTIFIDLLKQTAQGVKDGASWGGQKGVAKVAGVAGAIVEAFDSDDPYGALGQLFIEQAVDYVNGEAKIDNKTVDDAKNKAAEKAKEKLIESFFPGKPKKAKTFYTKVGKCSVSVTPEFSWMSAGGKGGLTVYIDGDCGCTKTLELQPSYLKFIQNPNLQQVKTSKLGRFKLIVFLPIERVETSVSFSGKPVDLTKLAKAAAKFRKAALEGDKDAAKEAAKEMQDLTGKATKLDAKLKLRPIFAQHVTVREIFAECDKCPENSTVTTGGGGGTTEPKTPPPETDYNALEQRCDRSGKLREDIRFWKGRRDAAVDRGDAKNAETFNARLKEARAKLCPCVEGIANDPAIPKAARDEAKSMLEKYCVDPPVTEKPPAPQPPPPSVPEPPPQQVGRACIELNSLYEQWVERAKKYPSAANDKKRDDYRKKLCDCIDEHPEAATDELRKLCPPKPKKKSSIVIGFVTPSDARPNDHLVGRVVDNPKDYQNVPGLTVVETVALVPLDERSTPAWKEVVVDLGDGRQQPADGPVSCKVPSDGKMNVRIGDGPAHEVVTRPGSGTTPSTPQTPPACSPGAVDVVEGPFPGDGNVSVDVGERPAEVIAQSPRAVFFKVPPETPLGANEVRVRQGKTEKKFHVAAVVMRMMADQTNLLRGQSTNFEVHVSGLGGIRDDQWRPGMSAALLDRASVPPQFLAAGQPGRFVLILENASPQTVSIEGGDKITLTIERDKVVNGEYVYHGKIHSKRTGGFDIKGTLLGLLAPSSAD